MWKYEFIGVSGQANDRRHHQLSKILKRQYFFVPFLAIDPVSLHDHRDPYDVSIYKQASMRHNFMSIRPNLQVEVRALTFVPGGPYPKMHLFLKIPSNSLDDELHRKHTLVQVEIVRRLPLFESHQALAEIHNLISPLAPCPSLKSFSISKSAKIQAKKKNQLSNLAIMIMNHVREKDEQNARPQCNSCVDKGLDRVSYGKAQKSEGTNTIINTIVWGENKYIILFSLPNPVSGLTIQNIT
jgi:hypothetical protein